MSQINRLIAQKIAGVPLTFVHVEDDDTWLYRTSVVDLSGAVWGPLTDWETLIDWENDISAAIELVPTDRDDIRFTLSRIPPSLRSINEGDWEANFSVGKSARDHWHYTAQSDNPARAIAEAWLMMMEENHG